jgi:fructokinase
MTGRKLFGGMEGGGTKFACAVGTGPKDIRDEIRFPTTTPQETLGRAVAFFRQFELAAIGLAPFGPLDLDPASPSYGSIAFTPKDGWANAGLLSVFRQAFDLPLAIDLDVNAAAFGEWYWLPERKRMESLVYYTIGTGIGAGVISNGCIVHGLTHPEAGHVRIPHDRKKDPFPGICPFHGDCFEGLASGSAIARHWRQPAEQLSDDHPAWELEAAYIAYALVNTILQVSPSCIVLGGGVMEHRALFPAVRRKVRENLNGYISSPVFDGSLEEYIVPPALGRRSGVLGAIAMAKLAARSSSARKGGP